MANGHGGHRTPSNPAPVSGPGALSQRTDGGAGQPVRPITGLPYGEGQDYVDLQSSAPMAEASTAPKPRPSRGASAASAGGATPFGAPSEYPDEPLTAGNPMGPGPGSEVLSAGQAATPNSLTTTLEKLLPFDRSGDIATLYRIAQSRGW